MNKDDIYNSTTLGTILGLEYAATKAKAESRSTHLDGWAI